MYFAQVYQEYFFFIAHIDTYIVILRQIVLEYYKSAWEFLLVKNIFLIPEDIFQNPSHTNKEISSSIKNIC